MDMDKFKESINQFSDTANMEHFLLVVAYWLAVISAILLAAIVGLKVYNIYKGWKMGKKLGDRDDFL